MGDIKKIGLVWIEKPIVQKNEDDRGLICGCFIAEKIKCQGFSDN